MRDHDGCASGEPDAAETRRQLLEATIDIAGRHGQRKVTYRSVAGHVGVSHSLVRHYFGTREALLAEALALAASRDVAESALRSNTVEGFAAGLGALFEAHWVRQVLQIDYAIIAIRGDLPLADVRARYEAYIEQVAGTLEAIGVPDLDGTRAALVFAALTGLTLQHNVFESRERTDAVVATLQDLLRSLGGTGGRP